MAVTIYASINAVPVLAVTRVQPDGGALVPAIVVLCACANTEIMLAAVLIPAEEQSVDVRALDAVVSPSLAASGVVVEMPVTAINVQRHVVVLEKLNVTVWLLPLVTPVPRNTPLVRVPSFWLWVSVHVAPAPLTDGLPPPDDTANATRNVSPAPGVRVVLPLVVALISRLAGVFATTGSAT